MTRLKYGGLEKTSAIIWTLDKIAPVIAKISKAKGEKNGTQLMDEFWASIEEDSSSDKVRLLDKIWKDIVDMHMRAKYDVPRIIRRIKQNNPSIKGAKFYSAVKKRLVFENSPWLQLYYNVYHEKDKMGREVTVDTVKSWPQWREIQQELMNTYYPMGTGTNEKIDYKNDMSLTDSMRKVLDQYNKPQYKDSSGRINAICIVWTENRLSLKPAEDTNDPNVLFAMVKEWKDYMQLIYDELKDIPKQYVQVYDQSQCDIFLHDKEHYSGIAPHIMQLLAVAQSNPDGLDDIRYNSSHVYLGLHNMYLATKGMPIRPFDMSIDKDFIKYKQQKKEQLFNENIERSRLKQNNINIDKKGYINALNILFNTNQILESDFTSVNNIDDLKNAVDSVKQMLQVEYQTLKEQSNNAIYPFNDANIKKLFSNDTYGNIDGRIQLAQVLVKEADIDFNEIIPGKVVFDCIQNMYNRMNGKGHKINLPDISNCVDKAVITILKEKDIFSLEACNDILDISELEFSINYFKKMVNKTYTRILKEVPPNIHVYQNIDIDAIFSDEAVTGNLNKKLNEMKQLSAQGKLDFTEIYEPKALFACVNNIYAYVLGGHLVTINWDNIKTATISRLKRKVLLAAGRPANPEIVNRKREELFNKVEFWLSRHHILQYLPDVAEHLFQWSRKSNIGISGRQINDYLQACAKIQAFIEQYNLDEITKTEQEQENKEDAAYILDLWDEINNGEYDTPFEKLKELNSPESLSEFKDAGNTSASKVDMSYVYQKYGIIVHTKWLDTFNQLADAANTDISNFDDLPLTEAKHENLRPHYKVLEYIRNMLFPTIINRCKELFKQYNINTPDGQEKYFAEQDRIFTAAQKSLEDSQRAVKEYNQASGIKYRTSHPGISDQIWNSLDMPAKTFIDKYKIGLNTQTGKLSPIAIAYEMHKNDLLKLANDYYDKVKQFNIKDEDQEKAEQAYLDRDEVRIKELNKIVDQFDVWVKQVNDTARQFRITPQVFNYIGDKYNNMIATIRYRIDDFENLSAKNGICTGLQLEVLFNDMHKMALGLGVTRLTDYNIVPYDPALSLFTE